MVEKLHKDFSSCTFYPGNYAYENQCQFLTKISRVFPVSCSHRELGNQASSKFYAGILFYGYDLTFPLFQYNVILSFYSAYSYRLNSLPLSYFFHGFFFGKLIADH